MTIGHENHITPAQGCVECEEVAPEQPTFEEVVAVGKMMDEADVPIEQRTSVPIKPPMTQEECENWIMLKGQTGDPVFEIHLVDKEVDQDPTMRALMETITHMIHQGIMGMPFEESQQATKPDLEIVKP